MAVRVKVIGQLRIVLPLPQEVEIGLVDGAEQRLRTAQHGGLQVGDSACIIAHRQVRRAARAGARVLQLGRQQVFPGEAVG